VKVIEIVIHYFPTVMATTLVETMEMLVVVDQTRHSGFYVTQDSKIVFQIVSLVMILGS